MSIIDAASFSVVGTVEMGQGARGVMIDPSSRHVNITNIYGDIAAVLDLLERRFVATITTAVEPNGVSFSPIVAQAPAEIKLPLPDRDDEMPATQH